MLPHRLPSYNSSRPSTFPTFEPSFPRSPPPSPPKRGKVPFNAHGQKATPSPNPTVGRNKTVSSEDFADHATPSLPAPRPSLDSSDHSPLSHSSDPTDLAIITPPTPRSSFEFVRETQPLSFDQVLSRLKPLLDGTVGTAGERKMTIEGVSSDIVDKLRAKSRASELPGWENLRYVGFL